jgi:pimeloyl-ACP methyl ester carboxylesterase
MKRIEINGISMSYYDKGAGRPLILLHGGAGAAIYWKFYLEKLQDYYRVVAPDLRGHGRTDNPEGNISYKLMSDDIAAFVDKLEIESPILCGWSDGGQIALEVGLRYPEKVKAIIAGGVVSEISQEFLDSLKNIGVKSSGIIDYQKMEEAIPELLRTWKELHSPIYGSDYWKKLIKQLSSMWLDPDGYLGSMVRKIAVPALIVAGDRDQFIQIEGTIKLYKLIENVELSVVANSDHHLMRKNKEMFYKIIHDFIDRQWSEKKNDALHRDAL